MSLERLLALIALLFASIVWAGDAPAPAAKPVSIYTPVPEYPPIARRYNVSGPVVAKVRIEVNGRVSKVTIVQSPADVLSESAVRAFSKWRFKPVPEPTEGLVGTTFALQGPDEYAFSTDVRGMGGPAPRSASELGSPVTEGWSHVRLLINGAGQIAGQLVLKSSGDEFRKSRDAIVSKLIFKPAALELEDLKQTTVNRFSIEVLKDGAINILQYEGT